MTGVGEILCGVDVASQPGPVAGQFGSTRTAMASGGVSAEQRAKRHAECEQCSRPRAMAVGHIASPLRTRRGDRLGQLRLAQGRQISL